MREGEAVRHLLRCPRCGGSLRESGSGIHCTDAICGASYPVVDGIPVLIDETRSAFRCGDFGVAQQELQRSRGWKQVLRSRLPTLETNSTGPAVMQDFHARLLQMTDRPVLLNVGGKHDGALSAVLVAGGQVDCIEVDLRFRPRTRLIADPCALPLADASVDAAVIDAFLEHVVDPAAVVAEVCRVLKPGGLVYADSPFMLQTHGGAHDFTRFGHLGHRRLFRDFSEIASGVSCGPGSALALAIQYFLLSFSRSGALRGAIQGLCRLLFFWLKYFDRWLVQRPGAYDAALGFYFVGRKSGERLCDRELLRGYRGQSGDIF